MEESQFISSTIRELIILSDCRLSYADSGYPLVVCCRILSFRHIQFIAGLLSCNSADNVRKRLRNEPGSVFEPTRARIINVAPCFSNSRAYSLKTHAYTPAARGFRSQWVK